MAAATERAGQQAAAASSRHKAPELTAVPLAQAAPAVRAAVAASAREGR